MIPSMKAVLTTSMLGSVRRFGKNGILYEILGDVDKDTVRIRVIETGEETNYPKSHALRDPIE